MNFTQIKTHAKVFSKSQLVAFVLVFGVIGGFVLLQSRAAGCPFGNAYADGCSGAPAGTSQYPNMLGGYAARPPWNVAGVDYPVGIPAGTVLTPWRSASVANVSFDLASGQINCTGPAGTTVTLDGIDFTPAASVSPYIYGYSSSCNWVVKNSKFTCPGTFGNVITDNLTLTNSDFDQANCGDLSTFVQGSNVTLKYNWFKHGIQHILESGGPGTIDMEFNLFDDMLAQGNAAICSGQACHENWQQLTGTSTISTDTIKFNTNYQHTAGSGNGEGFQFYCNSGPCQVSNPVLSNNTMICLAGTGMSNVINGGDPSHPGNIVNGTNKDNYFDPSGCTPYYQNTITTANHWTSSGNIDMTNGKTINPADNTESATGSTANVWVATTGSDTTCVRGDQSKPCLTFKKACSLAQPGDVVSVAQGNYTAQHITGSDCPNASSSAQITFIGQSSNAMPSVGAASDAPNINGACSVTCADAFDLGFNSGGGTYVGATNAPSYLTFQNFKVTSETAITGNQTYAAVGTNGAGIVLDHISGGSFYLAGATNATVKNSDFGNCWNSVSHVCMAENSNDWGQGNAGASTRQASSYTIDNVTFHDYDHNSSGHGECWFSLDWRGQSKIQNSRFYNCVISGGIRIERNTVPPAGSLLTIQNNWFGSMWDTITGDSQRCEDITWGNGGSGLDSVLIRYNTFSDGGGPFGSSGSPTSAFKIIGNLVGFDPNGSCEITPANGNYGSATVDHNIWVGGDSGTNSAHLANDVAYNALFINPAGDGSGNYHLANNTNPAIGFVPNNGADYSLSVDKDGNSRSYPTDAGAQVFALSGSIPGDLNSDGHVNITDLSILLSHYGQSGQTISTGDCNSDGSVTITDLSILLSHYGQ